MRYAKVVALLVALGAALGAFVGVLLMFGLLVAQVHSPWVLSFGPYLLAGLAGAFAGSLTGPTISLLLLRRVPIWRATMHVAAAAGFGVSLGIASNTSYGWALSGIVCALAMALLLRRVYRDDVVAADQLVH